MGSDTPLRCSLSGRNSSTTISNSFRAGDHPPVDAIREELIVHRHHVGPEANMLEPRRKSCAANQIELADSDKRGTREKLKQLGEVGFSGFKSITLSMLFPGGGKAGWTREIAGGSLPPGEPGNRVGYGIIVLSDRGVTRDPCSDSGAACGLSHSSSSNREGNAHAGCFVIRAAAPRGDHFALLLGLWSGGNQSLSGLRKYSRSVGQGAVMAWTCASHREFHQGHQQRPVKVISKMGISTFQSYCGAQCSRR